MCYYRPMSIARLAPAAVLFLALVASAQTFRVATYNLQNYLDAPAGTRPAKSEVSKVKIREGILAAKPDVLAVQEIGGLTALHELRDSLKREGLQFVDSEIVYGWDTNIYVGVLSRFPITARRPRTNDSFALFEKEYRVRRGFAEVDIHVNDRFSFTLIAAHLKSKLSFYEEDEQEMRAQEATLLRRHVDAILGPNPKANVVVLGDLNDTQDSVTVRTVIARKNALIDTRPFEDNGDDQPSANPRHPPRITWTHYYGKEDSFRRVDYILLSRNLARHWVAAESRVVRIPNWGVASDHRPVVAAFTLDAPR
jgi:endonuclease/exonuclease/phosphatase family metal-dependent hydrolase